MTDADFKQVFNLPFSEAESFFKQKLNIPTQAWTDLYQGEHAKGFMSAGAYHADLLTDLRGMVDKAIGGGLTKKDFREQFRPLVEKYGWQLKGGGPAWRSDLIWQTNRATAFAAGQWQQMEVAGIKYLRYVHADGIMHPRPTHQAMNGIVRPRLDVFWSINYPPNGFRCHCRAEPVSEKEYAATPQHLKELPEGWQTAPDKGWRYNVGSEGAKEGYKVLANKFETLPADIAKAWMNNFVKEPAFAQFISGEIKGNFPVAILDEQARSAIGADSQTAWLSDDSLAKNKGLTARSKGHPELTLEDYQLLPEVIGNPQLVVVEQEFTEIFVRKGGQLYLAVVKATQDRNELFVTSFRKTTMADVARKKKSGKVLFDELQ